MLAALAWAVVGHAGGAPGRGYDLVALGPVSQRPTAHRRSDADVRSIAVGSHTSRCLRRECRHEQQRRQNVCDLHRSVSLVGPRVTGGTFVAGKEDRDWSADIPRKVSGSLRCVAMTQPSHVFTAKRDTAVSAGYVSDQTGIYLES